MFLIPMKVLIFGSEWASGFKVIFIHQQTYKEMKTPEIF